MNSTSRRIAVGRIAVGVWVLAGSGPLAAQQVSAIPEHQNAIGAGIAVIAPQLSETLGSIYAGAILCGLTEEARAIQDKHGRHLDRLVRTLPGTDRDRLASAFQATSNAYRQVAGSACSEAQRQEIRHHLPAVFASIDAYDDALSARE